MGCPTVRRYLSQLSSDDLPGLAAELAYRFMFATFPFIVFVASLSAFAAAGIGISDPVTKVLDGMGRSLPTDLVEPIRRQLNAILLHKEPELLSIGALLTLVGAAGGMGTLMKAMNRAFKEEETRSLVARILLSVGLTIFGGLAVVTSIVAIIGGTLATQQLIDQLGIGGIWPVLALLRWPIAFGLLVAAGSVMLHFAPVVRPPWRLTVACAAASSVAWIVVTFAFGVYVARFGSFGVTYGALAGVIVLMIWYYISALVLLLAVELVAVLSRFQAEERGRETAAN